MKEKFLHYKEQMLNLWKSLEKKHKIFIGVILGILLVTIIVLIVYANKPNYAALFTKLNTKDAGLIANKLDEMKVPYKLTDGGTGILVPKDQVYKARIDLAAQGLPKNGTVGFEIFDQTKFGTTEFEQKVNYIRALNGELARTITNIDGVEEARVQIVVPESKLYVDQQQQATASVLLDLAPGKKLKTKQIKGIVRLVSSSVEGLTEENVTVVSSTGEVLSAYLEEEKNPDKLTTTQLELRQQYEKKIEKSIQTMLDKIMGPGRAVTRVTAELDFDKRQLKSETYSPVVENDGIVRSKQEIKENYQNQGGNAAQGIPGTTTNIPQYQAVITQQGGNSQYSKKDVTENYEVNKVLEQREVASGYIKKLSVSVVVDGQLTAAQRNSLQEAVAIAAGIDYPRGDQVTVQNLPFNRSVVDDMRKQMDEQVRKEKMTMFIYAVVALLAVAIAGFVLLRVIQQHRKKQEELELDVPELQELATVKELESDLQQIKEAEEEVNVEEMSEEEKARYELKQQIEELVKTNPEGVASIIKSWLSEE